MVTKVTQEGKSFRPITLQIVFENEHEFNTFKAVICGITPFDMGLAISKKELSSIYITGTWAKLSNEIYNKIKDIKL